MSRTKVSICNEALVTLGEKLISSLEDTTKAAGLCEELFDASLDEVLRMSEWNCAIARQSLTELEDAPAFEWDHQYSLPSEPYCIMALEINEDRHYRFAIEGRVLLTNEDSVNLRYIKRVTDMTEFDPLCARAVALNLAYKLAYPLMQSRKMKELIYSELQEILSIGGIASRREDSQRAETEQQFDWLTSRI
ncbi:MAG: hypothetical protein AVO39_10330 [delta proteobacterium MLS_D]|jgi:hypothetical protein|nr:MAG: hypothetical protein AVO39_10330 [delta proteobacterium MLS_D]